MKDMRLYRFDVEKNGRTYTNFVMVWEYNKKTWRMYVRPSFFKDYKIASGGATRVKAYKDCN